MFFQKKNPKELAVERGFYSLGTLCSIKIFPNREREKHPRKVLNTEMEEILDNAEEIAYEVDNQFSVFKEESEISAINKNSGGRTTKVSSSTYFLIKKAAEYCAMAEGGMDITIGPLSKIWRESVKAERLPSSSALLEIKKLVDFKNMKLEESDTTVLLEKQGMELDLGCIAKGYCADLICEYLENRGITKGVINLGGNIVVMGSQPSEKKWRIGVQHPNQGRGNFVGYIDLQDLSVVTSGDYERYFEKDGKRYHHIIDPRTAWPLDSEIVSVTIISKSSMEGDGLTTGVFMLGIEKGMKLINKLNGVEGLIITNDKEIHISEGIRNDFQLEDNAYSLV